MSTSSSNIVRRAICLTAMTALFGVIVDPALAASATRTRLQIIPGPSNVGQTIQLFAEVDAISGGPATGRIDFLDGATGFAGNLLSPDGASMAALALGDRHTCAITAGGGLRCWGANNSGQLGDGTGTDRQSPVAVTDMTANVTRVAAGYHHTCASLTSLLVKCWGRNDLGQLGDGTTTTRLTPVAVQGLTGIVSIAAGETHTCALHTTGRVKCWGNNGVGQLGNGTITNSATPVLVSGLSNAVAIELGNFHSCALTATGGVKCWGSNYKGQLGDGTTTDRLTPVNVVGLTSGVSAVSGGVQHTCAVTNAGGLKCWGDNYYGQLGDGTTISRSTPFEVVGLTSGVHAVTAGFEHSCAVLSGAVKCWGHNDFGQIGDNTTIDRLTPATVSNLPIQAVAIGGHWRHTCVLSADHRARCWGANPYGQLGDGTTDTRLRPRYVAQGLSTVVRSRASVDTSSLAIGTHPLSAVYGGDVGHNGSTGVRSQIVR